MHLASRLPICSTFSLTSDCTLHRTPSVIEAQNHASFFTYETASEMKYGQLDKLIDLELTCTSARLVGSQAALRRKLFLSLVSYL